MPKGIRNTPLHPQPVIVTQPAGQSPMIMLHPEADTWHLDAYGLDRVTIVDVLRLALIHVVATQLDVQIVNATFSRHTSVVATPAPAVKAKPPAPPTNGTGPKKPVKLQHRNRPMESWDDEPDLREDLAAALDSIEV